MSRSTELKMETVDSGGHWKSLYEVLAVWFGAKPISFMRITPGHEALNVKFYFSGIDPGTTAVSCGAINSV